MTAKTTTHLDTVITQAERRALKKSHKDRVNVLLQRELDRLAYKEAKAIAKDMHEELVAAIRKDLPRIIQSAVKASLESVRRETKASITIEGGW